jgi:hypothetical protein
MAVKENRFGPDRDSFAEIGVLQALFDEFPASEVGVCSGAQCAFDAAKQFITSMIENQCVLAGCTLNHQPYGVGDVHTEKCWFTKRALFYRERQNELEESA